MSYGHGDALAVARWAANLVRRSAEELLVADREAARWDDAECMPDPEPTTCPNCNGVGLLPYGPFGEEPECRVCRGSGEVYEMEEED